MLGKEYTLEILPHPYYHINVGNYIILYVIIGHVMEVRRFLYYRRNWQSWGL